MFGQTFVSNLVTFLTRNMFYSITFYEYKKLMLNQSRSHVMCDKSCYIYVHSLFENWESVGIRLSVKQGITRNLCFMILINPKVSI